MITFFAYCLAGVVSACYALAMHTTALRRNANGTTRPRDQRRLRIIGEYGRGTIALLFAWRGRWCWSRGRGCG